MAVACDTRFTSRQTRAAGFGVQYSQPAGRIALFEAIWPSGDLIGNNDLWIAAHAKSLGVTLVTNNECEFMRVGGLTIENWAKG
jgi:predicted nucleic acid-binding protein